MSLTYKSVQIQKSGDVEASDMDAINALALSELSPEDVFTFKVAMCDNAIDRDFECFSDDALVEMSTLFVGKTVVKDHDHKADNQVARIYAAEVVDGADGYKQLVAKCYMLKTASNADLIADIKGGIKKEVSVGVSIKSAVCSICGKDNAREVCRHYHGMEYDGKTCYFTLGGVMDAYELSFVAIPAQRAAGTTKSYLMKEEQVEDEKKPEEELPVEPDEEQPSEEPEEAPEGEPAPEESPEPEDGEEQDPEQEEPLDEEDPKACKPEEDDKTAKRLRINDAWLFVKRKELIEE